MPAPGVEVHQSFVREGLPGAEAHDRRPGDARRGARCAPGPGAHAQQVAGLDHGYGPNAARGPWCLLLEWKFVSPSFRTDYQALKPMFVDQATLEARRLLEAQRLFKPHRALKLENVPISYSRLTKLCHNCEAEDRSLQSLSSGSAPRPFAVALRRSPTRSSDRFEANLGCLTIGMARSPRPRSTL